MLGFNLSVGRNRQSFGDADAQAFIAATGLTGTTETTAVRRLVANLKTYGLWSKMKAIYPFVSDTINLISYSEDFSNAYWGKARISISANTIISPDGTQNADSMVEDTTLDSHPIYRSITTTNATIYTISIFAKQGTRQYLRVNVTNGGSPVYYDLLNKTASSGGSIYDVGNGWCRLVYTYTTNSTSGEIYIEPSINGITTTYLGNGSTSTYIWGAQLEVGSSATTYQPIATTPANRFVSQFKYNLKDPRDLDAAFRLAFSGTWTYTKQGATPNGVNGYCNTYLNPVAQGLTTASAHLSYYARTQASTTEPCEMGNYTSSSIGFTLHSKSSLGTSLYYYSNNYAASYPVAVAPTGLLSGSSIANTRRDLYFNGVSVANNTTTDNASLGNYNAYIGACNYDNSTAVSFSNAQTGFSSIGQGLTSTEMANLYTSVQLFQQDLSRQVGVPIVSDSDAQSFLNAAVITDTTQANAINTLVVGLKNASLWTKMKAIYPFVGGTATTHKWNLKDPRDLDAAYRLAFSGAWTHSSTGALPNGANAYADSFFNPLSNAGASGSLSYYNRTNSAIGFDGGCNDGTKMWAIISRYTSSTSAYGAVGYNAYATTTTSSAQGFVLASNNTNQNKLYRNGSLIATTTSNYDKVSGKIYFGAINWIGTAQQFTDHQTAFAHIGDGLSDAENSSLYTLVQAFQTSLSRQV